MSSAGTRRDLIVLVADRNMSFAITEILNRPSSLNIRKLAFVVRVHPQKDPGVLRHAHDFLRTFVGKYEHAIAMFDREGCGREGCDRQTLELEVESRLARNGWSTGAVAVALDPELESWVWSDSPEVEQILGWQHQAPDLRTWLNEKRFLEASESKPRRPKEAMEAALRRVKRPRSSALYGELARRVGFSGCVDPAFKKFRRALSQWFSP